MVLQSQDIKTVKVPYVLIPKRRSLWRRMSKTLHGHSLQIHRYLQLHDCNPIKGTFEENNLDIYRNKYGEDYGTKWLYFPDDDGKPHYINLTITEDITPHHHLKFDDIEFRLYIGNDTESYILLNRQGKPIKRSYQKITKDILYSNKPIKIITHGWRSSADSKSVATIKNAYLESRDSPTVITVSWSKTAKSIVYFWAAMETKTIGHEIAVFLEGLNQLYNVSSDKIHLIGHSLGAHVMGIAASKMNSTISRVTGLDPAGPLFEFPQVNLARLRSSDAEVVDVIHTCSGLLGYNEAIGTVDFYPNGGTAPQPECINDDFLGKCSHAIAYYYFTKSIKYPKSFPAYQCESWMDFITKQYGNKGFMGEDNDRNMSGEYYLKTKAFD